MALTQAQWNTKITSFLPSWWFEQDRRAPALVQAIAAIFAQLDHDGLDAFNSTFITRATAPVLDLLGDERNLTRLAGESDPRFAARIQRITSQTDRISIKAAVDSLLINPGCKLLESPMDNPYCNRGSFCSRDNYLVGIRDNFFVLVIPKQLHLPYSFMSRGNYQSRKDFMGSSTTTQTLYPTIIVLVNAMKAFGVLFSIVESNRTSL